MNLFEKIVLSILYTLDKKVKDVKDAYKEAERKAMDKEWSTARTPNPDAFHFQDNFLVQLVKKYKSNKK